MRFFRSVRTGRRCAAASRLAFEKGKTPLRVVGKCSVSTLAKSYAQVKRERPARPFPAATKTNDAPSRAAGRRHISNFSLKCFAFQTIRPVVSRKKRGFSAHFGPGGAMPPPRVSPFAKAKRSYPGKGIGYRVAASSTVSKASITSPILMSLKFSRPTPHSLPLTTSRASSLKRLRELILPV